MENENKLKSDPKGKAIASFMLGIINIIPTILILLLIGLKSDLSISIITNIVIFLGFFHSLIILISLLGIIFGIMGLRSTKKPLAIVGIIFSLNGLGVYLYLYFFPPWRA